jgi:hypothetical protein
MGSAVDMEQGNHRSLLTSCTFDRSKPDATWEALSVWADFEPKARDTLLCFPEEFTREFEQAWNHLGNLCVLDAFDSLPDHRRKSMRDFSMGLRQIRDAGLP